MSVAVVVSATAKAGAALGSLPRRAAGPLRFSDLGSREGYVGVDDGGR